MTAITMTFGDADHHRGFRPDGARRLTAGIRAVLFDFGGVIAEVMALFAHVIESWKIGARKPEPRFLRARVRGRRRPAGGVRVPRRPRHLKPARAMGMTTIKVCDPAQAVADLEAVLGHPVR